MKEHLLGTAAARQRKITWMLTLVMFLLLLGLSLLPSVKWGSNDSVNFVSSAQSSSSPTVIVVNLNVQIDAGSSGLVSRAIGEAQSSGASAVIIDMNTPGGLLTDMISIVDSISNSSVPVYTYVGNDSLAASAGSYIAMATNLIFMGPGSQIGPSTPIVVGGTALEQNHTAAAMLSEMQSLASEHGRNTTATYQMVVYDVAYSQSQAIQYHVADGASNSLSQTLQDLNLSNAKVVTISESPTEQLISTLSNPTVDGILFTIGIIAIALDFLHPTIWLSIAGVIMIVFALIGAEAIQGSGSTYALAVPLVLFAVAATLIVFEIKTGHGFMLFAGVVVGAFATLLLAYQVPYSPSPIGDIQYIELTILIAAGGLLALYARWVSKSIRSKPLTGEESMAGKKGTAYSDISPEGEAEIDGIIWKARIAKPDSKKIQKGQSLVVRKVDGLTLLVEQESSEEKP